MKIDYNGEHKNAILKLAIEDSQRVLDIGCGNGEKTFFLAPYVKEIVGIEPEEQHVQEAREKFRRCNLTFSEGVGESLDFPNASFDLVLFNESLHHIPEKKQANALNEAYRVLTPGGKCMVTEPVVGEGAFEKIILAYNDESRKRESALNAVKSAMETMFSLKLKEKIRMLDSCKGFDDLYRNGILPKYSHNWDESRKDYIMEILEKCDKNEDGDFILDYYATIWLLVKQ